MGSRAHSIPFALIQKGNVPFPFEITDRHSGALRYLRGFILLYSAGTKKWKRIFLFIFRRGFFFFPLLASVFYPENLILHTNSLTLSLSSGDEINCFLIHPPFLVAALIVTYSWTSVSRPRLCEQPEEAQVVFIQLLFFISWGKKKKRKPTKNQTSGTKRTKS